MKTRQLPLLLAFGLLLIGVASLLYFGGEKRELAPSRKTQPPELAVNENGPEKLTEVGSPTSTATRSSSSKALTAAIPEEERVPANTETVLVRYKVYSETGEDDWIPVSDAEVRWTLSDGNEVLVAEGKTKADENGLGEFELEISSAEDGLLLKLHGHKQGWIQEDDCEIDGWDLPSFREALEEPVELHLGRGVWLKGFVYAPDGSPGDLGRVLATRVTSDPEDEEAADGFIEDGEFSLALYTEGIWNLSATCENVGTARVDNIVISMEQDPPVLELHLRGSGSLTGTVRGADKKPLRGVDVYAVLVSSLEAEGRSQGSLKASHLSRHKPARGAFGARRAKRKSAHDGTFEISGLEPGRYALACLQATGDRYTDSKVVFADTNGAPIELSLELCLLTVRLEVLPGSSTPDSSATETSPSGLRLGHKTINVQRPAPKFSIECTRFNPPGEGPAAVGSNRFAVPAITTRRRSAEFLVVPGHLYEVRAAPDAAPHLFGGIISLEGIMIDPEMAPVDGLGREARRQVAIPRGRGKQEVTLTLPAEQPPGTLQFDSKHGGAATSEGTPNRSALTTTWSLALFSDAEELITNHELWKKSVLSSDLPLSLSLQPGRYRLRAHSSHGVSGSPIVPEAQIVLTELHGQQVLSGRVIRSSLGSRFTVDDGVESWTRFEIFEGQTHEVILEHVEGGTLELGLDVHLNGSEEALDLGDGAQDLAELWRARRLARDASGEWRHINLNPISQPDSAPPATTWYRSGHRLAPGAWTLRLETTVYGTLEADFVVRAGETTRIQLRADLE